jgi:hypothetical protein
VTKKTTEQRLDNLERNQEVTIKLLQLILLELGIRKDITEVAKELEARNGSDPPASVGA